MLSYLKSTIFSEITLKTGCSILRNITILRGIETPFSDSFSPITIERLIIPKTSLNVGVKVLTQKNFR